MANILESMFLLELDRLETKNCLACSTATLTDNGKTPQDLSIEHSCYNHKKQQLNTLCFQKLIKLRKTKQNVFGLWPSSVSEYRLFYIMILSIS